MVMGKRCVWKKLSLKMEREEEKTRRETERENETEIEIIDWNDGHRPGATTTGTKMVINHKKAAEAFFTIFDNFLDEVWCERIYEYAMTRGRPWGAYVTTSDVLNHEISVEEEWKLDPHRAISLEVVRTYFRNKQNYFLHEDSNRIHGCAVWCLASGLTNQVEYHIDYAELYRYETNIIHPPLYAGTCQVSPLIAGEMVGGDFYANSRGLDHYKEFGYKGLLKPPTELESDISRDDWIKIRYKRNRGTIHDGDFPHFSSPIKTMPEGKKRVILGLNFFSSAVGECCIRAPEHSDAFNRTVKLYQMMSKLGNEFGTAPGGKYDTSAAPEPIPPTTQAGQSIPPPPPTKKGFSAKDIAKNPAMARMFIMAAKKMKEVQIREGTLPQPESDRKLE